MSKSRKELEDGLEKVNKEIELLKQSTDSKRYIIAKIKNALHPYILSTDRYVELADTTATSNIEEGEVGRYFGYKIIIKEL